ncbi:MAG TPA: hypothetical protein VJ385_08045, partial [Fibrobacteria bacterium]|nr:hypothetical protein [Fibrobacteria bacterium]
MLKLTDMAGRSDLSGPAGLSPDQTWPALAARRDAWRDALLAARGRPGCVALHFQDTFAFAAALLGTWAAGRTAVIAGDATEITATLLAGRAVLFLGEFPSVADAWPEPPPPRAGAARALQGTPLPA